MSMTSFQDRPVSQGMNRKATPAPSSDTSVAPTVNAVSNAEVEKVKARLTEVERILMQSQLTMKNLGEQAEEASVSNGRKSNGKFDNDWTMKVEIKL